MTPKIPCQIILLCSRDVSSQITRFSFWALMHQETKLSGGAPELPDELFVNWNIYSMFRPFIDLLHTCYSFKSRRVLQRPKHIWLADDHDHIQVVSGGILWFYCVCGILFLGKQRKTCKVTVNEFMMYILAWDPASWQDNAFAYQKMSS